MRPVAGVRRISEARGLAGIIRAKEELKRMLEKELSPRERLEAVRDHHAHRPPRPCGMTIHTGIGCPLRCTYCYIEDMGFPWSVKPYPLTGKQLVYALLNNPSFIPGRDGTLIAIGSVTEPFLPQTLNKALEYIENIAVILGNPIQFSTKMILDRSIARKLASLDPGISPLVTIITINHHRELEPHAPPPGMRFRTIKNLADEGLKPILFYRPIIPGIAEEEYEYILEEAKDNGAVGIVAGTLRVTPLILKRLGEAGISIKPILERLPRKPRLHEQVPIRAGDIKRMIMNYAGKIGLIPFPEACMANLYTHGRICWKMIHYRIKTPGAMPPDKDFEKIRRELSEAGYEIHAIKPLRDYLAEIILSRKYKGSRRLVEEYVRCSYKLCVRTRLFG